MILYFVRHGKAENPDDIVYGRMPGFPLNQSGRTAVVAMAREIFADKKVAAIYYSPLERAQETAQLIRDSMKCKPPLYGDERLFEAESVFVGEPAEKLRQSGRKQDLAGWFKRCVPESTEGIQKRVLALVDDLKALYLGENEAVILVSHADTIGPALCALLGEEVPQQPTRHVKKCSVHEVRLNGKAEYKLLYEGV